MTDIFSKNKRSEVMRAVKSKGNKTTELKLIKIFKEHNIKGWRRNCKLKGRPDFVFPNLRVAVFVDGCFWHGHGCRNTMPKHNPEFWQNKIRQNRARDRIVSQELSNKGWKVLRIWECELKDINKIPIKDLKNSS